MFPCFLGNWLLKECHVSHFLSVYIKIIEFFFLMTNTWVLNAICPISLQLFFFPQLPMHFSYIVAFLFNPNANGICTMLVSVSLVCFCPGHTIHDCLTHWFSHRDRMTWKMWQQKKAMRKKQPKKWFYSKSVPEQLVLMWGIICERYTVSTFILEL